MEVVKVENFDFTGWLKKEMSGFDTVLDLGAGYFGHLADMEAKVKIGIEIFKPYIDNAHYKDCFMFHGNMIHYRGICMHLLTGRKAVMLIDALEHIPMPFAVKLVSDLKEDFDKIVIMSPRGFDYQSVDVTGLGNEDGQTHKSFWFEQDFLDLGMTEILVDENYHTHDNRTDRGCFFVKWEKL